MCSRDAGLSSQHGCLIGWATEELDWVFDKDARSRVSRGRWFYCLAGIRHWVFHRTAGIGVRPGCLIKYWTGMQDAVFSGEARLGDYLGCCIDWFIGICLVGFLDWVHEWELESMFVKQAGLTVWQRCWFYYFMTMFDWVFIKDDGLNTWQGFWIECLTGMVGGGLAKMLW